MVPPHLTDMNSSTYMHQAAVAALLYCFLQWLIHVYIQTKLPSLPPLYLSLLFLGFLTLLARRRKRACVLQPPKGFAKRTNYVDYSIFTSPQLYNSYS